MATPGIPSTIATAARGLSTTAGERRLRLVLAGVLLAFLAEASAGLAWDIAWHTFIGRDSFLTPPHAVLYSGVAGAGITCLAAVLIETWRRHMGAPGVDAGTTVSLLRVFRAPLGFFVAGFGMLTLVVAAPLDNLWHELYGLDVTLWAPFHVMGLAGGIIGILGLVYVLAAEAARDRRAGWTALTIVLLFALSNLLRGLVVTLQPAQGQDPTTDLGTIQVLTMPVGLAFAAALAAVAALTATRLPGAAVLMVLLAAAFAAVLAVIAPALVREAAITGGYAFRNPAGPRLQRVDIVVPFALLLPALLVEAAGTRLGPAITGGLAAIPAALIGAAVPLVLTQGQPATAVALGLALALPAGALGGWLGGRLGTVWRWNER